MRSSEASDSGESIPLRRSWANLSGASHLKASFGLPGQLALPALPGASSPPIEAVAAVSSGATSASRIGGLDGGLQRKRAAKARIS